MLGVREYFAFDPQGYWRLAGETRRLRGWNYELGRAEPVEIEGDEEGRLWSEALQSFLVVEGRELRVYDRAMNERLTGEEAEKIARQQAEIERRRADAARQQAEAQRRLAEAARQQAEVEQQQTEVERQQAEERAKRLARKLRELNIDPDEL